MASFNCALPGQVQAVFQSRLMGEGLLLRGGRGAALDGRDPVPPPRQGHRVLRALALQSPPHPRGLSSSAPPELVSWEGASKRVSTHILPSLCSLNKHLLRTYCVPSPVLSVRMQKLNKTMSQPTRSSGEAKKNWELLELAELCTRDTQKIWPQPLGSGDLVKMNLSEGHLKDYNLAGSSGKEQGRRYGDLLRTPTGLSCQLSWGASAGELHPV